MQLHIQASYAINIQPSYKNAYFIQSYATTYSTIISNYVLYHYIKNTCILDYIQLRIQQSYATALILEPVCVDYVDYVLGSKIIP